MMGQSRRHIDHSPAAAVAAANQSTGIRGNAVFVPPAAQQADTEVPILDRILQVRHLDQIPTSTTSTLPLSKHQVAIAAPTVAGLAGVDHAVPVAFVTVVREDITGTGLALITGTPAGYGCVHPGLPGHPDRRCRSRQTPAISVRAAVLQVMPRGIRGGPAALTHSSRHPESDALAASRELDWYGRGAAHQGPRRGTDGGYWIGTSDRPTNRRNDPDNGGFGSASRHPGYRESGVPLG